MSLARGFSRSGSRKNGREQTPPTSPKRTFSKRQNAGEAGVSKFQISAPVELISTTNMISYTSPSLRSSLGGSTNIGTAVANTSGQISSHKSSGSVSSHKRKTSGVSANHKSKESITLRTEQNIRMSIQKAHYYPPSPASSGGSLGPMSSEVGSGMDDILTPPTTPPPNHLTEYFPRRDSRNTNSTGSQIRSNSTSGTRKSSNSTSSSMEHHRQLSRIKSVSSLNSTSSGSSSSNRYSREKEMDPLPPLPTEFDTSRRANPYGAAGPTSAPAPQLRTHKSTISTSSTASFTYSAINSPALTSGPTSPVVAVPARSSARVSRSTSNPTLRNSAKAHRHHSGKAAANPFAHELAQVSELAEDMGLDFDEEYMARKGLLKFSPEDYLDLIMDVMYVKPSAKAPRKEEIPIPVVPLRKKPSLLRREEEKKMFASPAITAGQDGGWI